MSAPPSEPETTLRQAACEAAPQAAESAAAAWAHHDWAARAAAGETLPPLYFEEAYAAADDPWGFAASPYEREKRSATLEALQRQKYDSALEIGCSIGLLTQQLAARCEALLAVDVADRALEQARERVAGLANVRVARMRVPDEFPDERFDLVVLSEVGYYWSEADLGRAAAGIADRLAPGGHLLLVHWTPWVPDHPLTGDAVHELFLGRPEFTRIHGERHPQFRLDLLARV